MSVLNINELKKLANNGLLGDDYLEKNFQPSSYDLRIGSIFKDGKIFSKDFASEDFTNNIEIKPSEIVSILTLEKVTIPKNCVGTVFAVNKQSSTGLLILNPGHIDPGFSGPLSICAINLSKDVKTISLGEDIFTLILQKLETELKPNELYQNKVFSTRKELEQNFLKNKSKKLSNSFFDLILGYDGTKKMLIERLWDSIWNSLKGAVKIIAVLGGIAGILKLGYDAFPDSMPVFKKETKVLQDSIIDLKKDSIIDKQNKIIFNLNDSIRELKNTQKIIPPVSQNIKDANKK